MRRQRTPFHRWLNISSATNIVEKSTDFGSVSANASEFQVPWLENSMIGHNSASLDHDGSSSRQSAFLALFEALDGMSHLPETHEYFVSVGAIRKATDILGTISANLEIRAPKIFPHEGESVVLTWSDAELKRFLMIDDEDVDLLDVNKRTAVKCQRPLSSPDGINFGMLLSDLGQTSVSSENEV